MDKWDTISKHEALLSLPPSAIKCLVSILKYIRTILDEDSTQSLVDMVEGHLGARPGEFPPHKINLTELRAPIMHDLYQSFTNASIYTGVENDFAEWLLSKHELYDKEIPVDPDLFTAGLTQAVALGWFSDNHDKSLDAHGGDLLADYVVSSILSVRPVYYVYPENFRKMRYRMVDLATHDKLMSMLNLQLTIVPISDPIINFNANPDNAENTTTNMGVIDSDLLEYGEVLDVVWRKDLDYYSDHLSFVTNSTMDPVYATILNGLRSNVNLSYHKVLDVFTILRKAGLSISTKINIRKTTDKTLDLLNLVGLSKSLFAISLVSYEDNGSILNRLEVSFDNYNPDFTYVLKDGISDTNLSVNVVIVINDNESKIIYSIGDQYEIMTFDNSTKLFKIEPYFLFIPPKVDYPKDGTIRLSRIDIFNKMLSDDDAKSIIFDFNQR